MNTNARLHVFLVYDVANWCIDYYLLKNEWNEDARQDQRTHSDYIHDISTLINISSVSSFLLLLLPICHVLFLFRSFLPLLPCVIICHKDLSVLIPKCRPTKGYTSLSRGKIEDRGRGRGVGGLVNQLRRGGGWGVVHQEWGELGRRKSGDGEYEVRGSISREHLSEENTHTGKNI